MFEILLKEDLPNLELEEASEDFVSNLDETSLNRLIESIQSQEMPEWNSIQVLADLVDMEIEMDPSFEKRFVDLATSLDEGMLFLMTLSVLEDRFGVDLMKLVELFDCEAKKFQTFAHKKL